MLVIDIETKSECDIKKAGAWAYSLHPTTQVMCICTTDIETGETQRVDMRGSDDVTFISDKTLIAHNISFERAIYENVLNLHHVEKWIDTQDIAAYMGAPLSLAGAAEFLLGDNEADQKDKAGSKLMKKICTPSNRKVTPVKFADYTEAEFQGLMDYCEQDVHVSKRIYEEYAHHIPEYEWSVMQDTIEMNHRGIPVELELVDLLQNYYDEACNELTVPEGFKVSDVTRTEFMRQTLIQYGYPAENMTADTVKDALSQEDLNPVLRELLETRQILTMASVKKLRSLKDMCAGQPFFRNGFQYHGAKTGRYAGRGAQPQNLPKGFSCDFDIIVARDTIGAGI